MIVAPNDKKGWSLAARDYPTPSKGLFTLAKVMRINRVHTRVVSN